MAHDGKSDEIDVEFIVRQVVEELRIADDPPGQVPRLRIEENPSSDAGSTPLNASVITTEQLDEHLNGAKRIVVAPGTVITPAAKDLLREHNVEICVSDGTAQPQQAAQITIGSTGHEVAAVIGALSNQGIQASLLEPHDLGSLVETMTNQLTDTGGQCVLLTESTSAAVCLANRHRGVRAARALDIDDVREVVAALGANFLVITPRVCPTFQIARMIKEFHQAGPQPCPTQYQGLLD